LAGTSKSGLLEPLRFALESTGRRFSQLRDTGFSVGKIFGVVFGLVWVALGISMPFLPETATPGMGLFLKAGIGICVAVFGAFIVGMVWRNLGRVLEVDLGAGCLRHFAVDGNGNRHALREIAFQDVRGVFTEGEQDVHDNLIRRESLIISFDGRPGRLDALSAHSDQIAMVRDYIISEALHRQTAPVVGGARTFVECAKWEVRQRAR
jgi:hypothetical protein